MLILPFDEWTQRKIDRLFKTLNYEAPLEFLREFKGLYAKGGTEYPFFMAFYMRDYWEHTDLLEQALKNDEYETAVRELEVLHRNEVGFYTFGVWDRVLEILNKYIC